MDRRTTLRRSGDRQAERERDRFFDLSLDLLSILDAEQRPLQLNPAWERTLGWTLDELMSMSHRELIHPDDLAASIAAGEEVRAGGVIRSFENRYRTRDGSYRRLLWSVVADPEAGRIYAVARDVTDVKRTEEELARLLRELQERDRRKDEFLAMLAHELRNPLAPILNALGVLRLAGPSSPAIERQRDLIERQARQMARLVDDLLDVSRVTRGTIELRRSPVALATVLEEAVQTSAALVAGRGHRLGVRLPAQPVWLDADAGRLVQSFANLLHNAAKYTEPGGRIELAAETEGGEVAVRVRDTGRGIPAEVLPRIFDLFVQGDPKLDRAEGGLGIGLTLVKSLVEMHGGSVVAASEGPGRGSEITVRLPVLATPPPAATTEAPEPEAGRPPRGPGRRLRVLVVDDNADAAASVAELVELWGHTARVVGDGPSAITEAVALRPQVVLLDIGLPGMDGYEVARRLRELRQRALVVAVTGYGREEDRRRATEHGFDVHLTKPVDPADLRRLLDEARLPGDGEEEHASGGG